MSEIFTQLELSQPFHLPDSTLPTKSECLLYVKSRLFNRLGTRDVIVLELSRKVEQIWNKADCCPSTFKHIKSLFMTDIWEKYLYLIREKQLPGDQTGKKRSHKKNAAKVKR